VNTLFIVSDAPYGNERPYNALRLGLALAKSADDRITAFLTADAVGGARRDQKTPEGYYNIERMLRRLVASGGQLLLWGTCMDARGLDADGLIEEAVRSTMEVLAAETHAADKVLVF
jgi:uncharacterized protein involved in oxidation of intracellular sulfur